LKSLEKTMTDIKTERTHSRFINKS